MATLRSIVYQPIPQEYGQRIGDFMRVPAGEAKLIVDHGIEGDAKAGHNPTRQINLVSGEWLQARAAQGYKTSPGDFGEQLIIEDLAVDELQPGDKLQLGEDALIEITKGRTPCDRLEAAQGRAIEAAVGEIGMMAKVVSGGTIRVGDEVRVLETAPEN